MLFAKSFIDKLVWLTQLDIGLVLICIVIDLDLFQSQKMCKKILPLSSHLDLMLCH